MIYFIDMRNFHPPRYNPATCKLSIAYRKWDSMIQRCRNPNHIAYRYYGGRGITVSPLWTEREHGFITFWQELRDPPKGYWLDRIDNSKGYEPGNCRWVTTAESARNRGKTGRITPGSLRQKALAAGLPYSVVYQRVKLHGWDLDFALKVPVQRRSAPRKAVLRPHEQYYRPIAP